MGTTMYSIYKLPHAYHIRVKSLRLLVWS